MLLGEVRASFGTGCGALALLILTTPAFAQGAPPLPTPEQIERPRPDPARTSTVRIDSSGGIERQPCPLADSDLILNVASIRFVTPSGEPLAPEIAHSLQGISAESGPRPISVLCDLRDRANAALRADGWVASVQIPPQQITGEEVRLVVVTAKIVELRIRGSAGPYQDLLRSRVEALRRMAPLNERDAERLLLLTGDMPGLDIAMSLSPAGTAPGEVIGELNVSFHRYALLFNTQNYNSRLVGRETAYVGAEVYGLTGRGDVTYLGVSSTYDLEEQIIVQGGHVMTLNNAGTTLGARATYAWSRPDLGALDYRTETIVGGLDLVHPLARSVGVDAAAYAGFDYIDQETKVYSGGAALPLTEDRLRVLFAGVEGEWREPDFGGWSHWSLRGNLELRKGLDILDASEPGFTGGALQSRIDGDPTAWVLDWDVDGEVWPVAWLGLYGRTVGQWTDEALLNFEEFSLGNLSIGRGYDPGSNSADRAVGTSSEIRVNLPIGPEAPFGAQVFGFYDRVWIDNLDPNSTEVDRVLESYGAGVRLTMPGTALLEVTYAHPRDRALTIDPRPPSDRVLISLSFRYRDRAS